MKIKGITKRGKMAIKTKAEKQQRWGRTTDGQLIALAVLNILRPSDIQIESEVAIGQEDGWEQGS